MADIADKIRQDARAKEQRIETALAAIDVLTPDEAEFVYVKLEKKILSASAGSRAPAQTPKPKTAKAAMARGNLLTAAVPVKGSQQVRPHEAIRPGTEPTAGVTGCMIHLSSKYGI